ncbi:hypothetical protein SteCoe_2612 [Stentor coeruleus]|uniref:Uncharacterized protein n=1 Tax=Stentor coeruleus TaxID=5963 RepID=A0A1R2CZ49_9CILI|nr:hypothetical protein SteCoe_2612 [Stentor coeruleus]
MSTLSFTKRFKNKIDKLGRDGFVYLNASNPIDKSDIPARKIHQPFLRLLPSNSKVLITQKVIKEDNSVEGKSINFRSVTPDNALPQIRVSPIRNKEKISKSKSPVYVREGIIYNETEHIDTSISCPKLPKIIPPQYSIRDHIRRKLKLTMKKYF